MGLTQRVTRLYTQLRRDALALLHSRSSPFSLFSFLCNSILIFSSSHSFSVYSPLPLCICSPLLCLFHRSFGALSLPRVLLFFSSSLLCLRPFRNLFSLPTSQFSPPLSIFLHSPPLCSSPRFSSFSLSLSLISLLFSSDPFHPHSAIS